MKKKPHTVAEELRRIAGMIDKGELVDIEWEWYRHAEAGPSISNRVTFIEDHVTHLTFTCALRDYKRLSK